MIIDIGFHKSFNDYAIFTQHSSCGLMILLVYVDDIITTGDNVTSVVVLKKHLQR